MESVTPDSLVAVLARLDASSRLVLDLSLRRETPDEELAARFETSVADVGERRARAIAKITSAFRVERIDELVELLSAVAELPATAWAAVEEGHALAEPRARPARHALPPAFRRVGIAVLPALLAALITSALLARGLVGSSAPRPHEQASSSPPANVGGTAQLVEPGVQRSVTAADDRVTYRAPRSSAADHAARIARTRASDPRAGRAVPRRKDTTKHSATRQPPGPETTSQVALASTVAPVTTVGHAHANAVRPQRAQSNPPSQGPRASSPRHSSHPRRSLRGRPGWAAPGWSPGAGPRRPSGPPPHP